MRDNKNWRTYQQEIENPQKVEGEYLVSVRDNDEARLILGLEIGKRYTRHEITQAFFDAVRSIRQHRKLTAAERYRLISCESRLRYFDDLVVENDQV